MKTSISPSTVGFNIQDVPWITFHRPRVISIVYHCANLRIGSQVAWLRISNLLQASEGQILLLCWLLNQPLKIPSLESALRPSRHCALDVYTNLLAIESAFNNSLVLSRLNRPVMVPSLEWPLRPRRLSRVQGIVSVTF